MKYNRFKVLERGNYMMIFNRLCLNSAKSISVDYKNDIKIILCTYGKKINIGLIITFAPVYKGQIQTNGI